MNKDNNFGQRKDHESGLNYNSAPFIPKQCPRNVSNMLAVENNSSYYQGSNVNFNTFNGNEPIQYNPLDFMSYLSHIQNEQNVSNYWPIMPNNNYYESVEPKNSTPYQNMYMVGKTPETSICTTKSYSDTNSVQTNVKEFTSSNKQNSQKIKQNCPINVKLEMSSQGSLWKDKLLDKNINHMGGLNLSKDNSRKNQSIDNETYNEILDSATDETIRKRLSETMLRINPPTLLLKSLNTSKFFVIKSFSEDDLHRAIKYCVWSSTNSGNDTLDLAYRNLIHLNQSTKDNGRLFLFFSVNGSGFFAGIAEMISTVDKKNSCDFWTKDRWKGSFDIKWHYVKDVRNSSLRHIRSESNQNKPVTNCRDTTEITPYQNGIEFIKVFHDTKHETSLFDDFVHYNDKQESK